MCPTGTSELQGYCTGDQQARYRAAAEKMLDSLSSAKYRSDKKRPSFLDHSTGHKPAGAEIDASIIYADYYYLEALLRLKKLNLNQSPLTNLAKL